MALVYVFNCLIRNYWNQMKNKTRIGQGEVNNAASKKVWYGLLLLYTGGREVQALFLLIFH